MSVGVGGAARAAEPFPQVRAHVVRVPLGDSVKVAFGTMRWRQTVVLEIEDEDGVVGTGEIWANYPSWAPFGRVAAVTEGLAPLLRGADLAEPDDVSGRVLAALLPYGTQGGEPGTVYNLVSGLDMALHDLRARRDGVSLARRLVPDGEIATRVPAYASGLHVDTGPETIERLRAAGHTRFKFKCGFDFDRDLAGLRRLRTLLGEATSMTIDANRAFGREEALRFAEAAAPLDVGWFEEPIDPRDIEGMAWLRKRSPVPVAAGENWYGVDDLRRALRAGAVDVLQPDLAKTGGISSVARLRREVAEHGVSIAYHNFASALGVVASAHLSAGLTPGALVEIDATASPLTDAFARETIETVDGELTLPAGDGLGLSVRGELLGVEASPRTE